MGQENAATQEDWWRYEGGSDTDYFISVPNNTPDLSFGCQLNYHNPIEATRGCCSPVAVVTVVVYLLSPKSSAAHQAC